MHFLFAVVRIYPIVALCLGIVFFELTVFFYRRHKHPLRFACMFMFLFLLVSTTMWFVNRGDLYSDRWVKQWMGLR